VDLDALHSDLCDVVRRPVTQMRPTDGDLMLSVHRPQGWGNRQDAAHRVVLGLHQGVLCWLLVLRLQEADGAHGSHHE